MSRQHTFADYFLNSHYLSAWQCFENVRRIYMLVIPSSQRVNDVICD